MECLFCAIANKEIPGKVVYEDENVIAFLDIFPIADGHMLVCPKKHYVELSEMPAEEITNLFKVINKLYPVVERITNCDGIHLLENYGCAQEIKHVHFHIIPTYENNQVLKINKIGEPNNLEEIQNKLKKEIS